MKALHDCQLYTFVDFTYLNGRDPADLTEQLCRGGADLIQLRGKHQTVEELERSAGVMRQITSRYHVGLVVNDYPEIARRVGADLCHLGQEDFFDAGLRHVREVSHGAFGVGLSSHSPDQAQRAAAAEPGYVAIGPVFATATKPGRPAVTLEYVRWAAEHLTLPWFAIGGITLENIDEVLTAGARRVAVVSAILCAGDVEQACQRFRDHLTSAALK